MAASIWESSLVTNMRNILFLFFFTDKAGQSHSLDGWLHQEGPEHEDHAFDLQPQWRRKVPVSS